MNKKFMVVALMAALSTVGYAFDYSDLESGTSGHVGVSKAEEVFGEIQTELNGKADIDFVTSQVDKAYNDLSGEVNGKLEGKVDTEDFNRLDNEVGQITSGVEAMKGDLNNKVNKDEFENKLNEKADVDFVTSQVDQAYNDLSGKVDEKLEGKVDTEDFNRLDNEVGALTGKVEAVEKENERVNEEQNSKIEANKNAIADTNKQVETNKNTIASNTNRIENLEDRYDQVNGRVSGLEKRVDHLDDKMNKGLSLMAAMNAVDFQNVQTGEMAIGAGVGHYGNAQSVALGVAYSPVEDLTVNAKYSVTAGDADSFAVGAGATYKFKVGR